VVGAGRGLDLDYTNPRANSTFDYRVAIGQTGSVTSDSFALYMGSNDHSGVRIGGIILDNAGEITSTKSAAVFMFNALDAAFSNSGSIVSLDKDQYLANGVTFYSVKNAVFENTGDIRNWLGNTVGVASTAAVSFTNGTENVNGMNAGVITASTLALHSSATVTENFTNSGTMVGDVELSNTVGGNFNNSGKIFGSIDMRQGADTFDGRGGWVEGDVMGGLGDDVYIVDDSAISLVEWDAEGTDTVRTATAWTLGGNFENLDLIGAGNIRGTGNGLANIITGNGGNNRLNGKGDKDILSGGDGDDLIFGGAGRDVLYGDDGDDILRGGSSKDKLNGGTGNDVLVGGQADDRLSGGDGNDVLIGGFGTDVMTGGNGKDVFVFNRKADSLRGNPSDSITDFVIGEDRVDLSGLQPSLSYIGNGAFSGTAGEVQVTTLAGDSLISVDVDGDSNWDMRIVIDAVTGLSVADFIL
jgi:serralysin